MANLKDLYSTYDTIIYIALKWTLTAPATLAGNILDLCTLFFSKKLVNVSPIIDKFPFFNKSNAKEQVESECIMGDLSSVFDIAAALDSSPRLLSDTQRFAYVNKGFGGIFRMISTCILEIPIEMVSAVLSSFLALMHLLLTPVAETVGYCGNSLINNFG